MSGSSQPTPGRCNCTGQTTLAIHHQSVQVLPSSKDEDIHHHTDSKEPAMIRARLFVGNISKVGVTRDDLIELFKPYGRIIALASFKGYAFVQFAEAAEADLALKACHGMRFMGSTLDCQWAARSSAQESRKRSADDFSDRGREEAVRDGYDEVAELNRLNCVTATKDKTSEIVAATDEPKRIRCVPCNQRFLSSQALIDHLIEFHRTIFQLEDTMPEEVGQLESRQPTQRTSSMAGSMQQTSVEMITRQVLQQLTSPDAMIQVNPALGQSQQQQQSNTPSTLTQDNTTSLGNLSDSAAVYSMSAKPAPGSSTSTSEQQGKRCASTSGRRGRPRKK